MMRKNKHGGNIGKGGGNKYKNPPVKVKIAKSRF